MNNDIFNFQFCYGAEWHIAEVNLINGTYEIDNKVKRLRKAKNGWFMRFGTQWICIKKIEKEDVK